MLKYLVIVVAMLLSPSVRAQTKAKFELQITTSPARNSAVRRANQTWKLDGSSRKFSAGGLVCQQNYVPNDRPHFDGLSVICSLTGRDVTILVNTGCYVDRRDSDLSITVVTDGKRWPEDRDEKSVVYDIRLTCISPLGAEAS